MFFNKKNKEENTSNLVKIAALLIHTAKIDQNYSIEEEEIIKKTLVSLGAEQSDLDNLITKAIKSEENKEIKLVPEMLNLLGCSKDNFKKLIIKMNYKVTEKNDEIFFKYFPKKKFKKTNEQKTKKENPFGVLKNLNFN